MMEAAARPVLSLASVSLALASAPPTEASGQWIHVMPSGTFTGRDGRGPYRLENAASVIQQSRAYAGPRQIPVDYEHQLVNAEKNGQPAPAAGWIDALQARANGIWGRVTWTARAAAYIGRREYRYFSPTFWHSPDGTVRAIASGALTNTPNLPQLLAIARAETRSMDPNSTTPSPDGFLSDLRQLLGLPDTADTTAVLAAIRDQVTAATHSTHFDPTKFVPIGTLESVVAEVNRLNQGVSLQAATAHVDHQIRAGNLPPALKDWGVALCSVNKVAFDAFVERTRGGFNAIIDGSGIRGRPPVSHAVQLSADELAVCSRMGITEDEFMKARAFHNPSKA